jgi:DNA-binding response OmpR family regulator
MKKAKILVVDDEAEIRNLLKILLTKEDFEVVEAEDGERALQLMDDTFDLVVLDIMMPKKDGIEVCIDIRSHYYVPILFLSAKGSEYDKHIGFLTGCDDYIVKPFSSLEFLGRIKAMIRRYTIYKGKNESLKNVLHVKDLVIDEFSNRVMKEQQEIALTSIEYGILYLLAKNPQKIFTIENIYENVWHERYDYTVNNTVMVHIRNLRKKLNAEGDNRNYIKNIWGRGYCIETNTE